MSFRADRRAQAIQVGAVLLFAILILAFSTYQAFIIPADNRRVEFNHNQEVQERLAELRNAVLTTTAQSGPTAVTIPLGTRYPSRTLGLNPGPPGGTIRTVGTDDPRVTLTITNATVPGETGDFWNGSARAYDTGALEYDPLYNRYTEAPRTAYEHSVLYNRFSSGTLVLANQTLVNGNRLSIVTLDGSLSRTSDAAMTVNVQPISSSTESVVIGASASTEPITLAFASRLSVSRWKQLLSDEENVVDVSGTSAPAGGEFNGVLVELRTGEEYRLQMTKVAVGTGATSEPPVYLTDLAGDGATVARGSSQQLTLAVRDRYNNPVPGVTVNGAVAGPAGGSLNSAQETTDADGEVTFTYTASSTTTSGDQQLRFSMEALGGSFDASTPENVTIDVSVPPPGTGGGANPFAPTWVDPGELADNTDLALSECSAESCVWDVGASDSSTLRLNATSGLSAGFNIEFAGNNATVGTVSPTSATTDANGTVSTVLTPSTNGTVDIAATSGGGGDLIEIAVENVTAGSLPPAVSFVDHASQSLRTIAPDGTVTSTYDISQPPAIGLPTFDLIGGPETDVPHVRNQDLLIVEVDGATTVVDGNQVRTDPLGVGDWDEDGTVELVYSRNDGLHGIEPGGTSTPLEFDCPGNSGFGGGGNCDVVQTNGVAGIADIDGDGSSDVIHVTDSDALAYFDTATAQTTISALNNPDSISEPADFDGDEEVEIASWSSSDGEFDLYDVNGSDGSFSSIQAQSTPMAAADWNGDGQQDLIFIQNGNSAMRYFDFTTGSSTLIRNRDGQSVAARANAGVR